MNQTPTPSHVVLLSSPGMGHVIPLAALAICLTRRHGLSVTLVSNKISSNQQSLQDLLCTNQVEFLSLPGPNDPASLSSKSLKAESCMYQTVTATMPRVRSIINSVAKSKQLAAIVVDPFYLDALDIAQELNIPCFLFFTVNCMVLSFAFELPNLDERFKEQYRDMPEPLHLPGCVPVRGIDLHDAVQDRTSETYKEFVTSTKRFKEVSGVLVNSFEELEPGPVNGLKEFKGMPPVYPVGPLILTSSTGPGQGNDCLSWLDKKPQGSVVFVSFGSGGALTWQQMQELALGLELSRQHFLWVVRSPNEKESNAYFFGNKDVNSPSDSLPAGFSTRTEQFGLVVHHWAPQAEVLAHPAIGGFVTHCGWNSVLESLVHGVPLVAWPLYAEQKMNAVLLTDDVKVALRPKQDDGGLVGRDEVSRVVSCLMKGKEAERLRGRAQELSRAAANALDQGGSSFKNLLEATSSWKTSVMYRT